MSDTPRDQEPGRPGSGPGSTGAGPGGPGNEPVTGPPAGATAAPGPAAPRRARGRTGGDRGGKGRGGLLDWLRSTARDDPAGPETDPQRRRRRRWFIAGISVAAAVVVVALCAGTVSVVSAVSGYRDRNVDAREDRRVREGDCLALEQRLNKLIPPGATATPQARAVAVRDENAAVRIYVNEIRDRRDSDGWRQLLDARTAYAEALDLQAKSRTPAFFVAPRSADGRAVTDQLVRWSAASCAGPIRRLAAPDL